MADPLRHRQTKGAATDMVDLTPPRHIPTLPPQRSASFDPPATPMDHIMRGVFTQPGSRSEGLEACKRVCLVPETGCEPTIRTRRSLASNLMLGGSATTPQDYPQ